MAYMHEVGQVFKSEETDPFVSKEVTWKIQDVKSKCNHLRSSDTGVTSPKFSFANGTWVLFVKGNLTFSLRRLNSHEAEQEILCKCFIKTHAVSHSSFGSLNFDTTPEDIELLSVCESSDGAIDVDAKLREIAPEDTLTVVCQMHTLKPNLQFSSLEDIVTPVGSTFVERNEYDTFIFNEFTWKIPNFYDVHRYTFPETVRSPEFSFANGTWILCVNATSFYDEDYGEQTYVRHFRLRRMQSLQAEQEVYVKFYSHTGITMDANYHNFTFMDSEFGFRQISLEQVGNSLTDPSGYVTVRCQMHTSRTAQEKALGANRMAQQTKVLLDLEKLLLSKDGSDVTLQVSGHTFQAHRAILRARSPVFASMLTHDMRERKTGVIDIQDCEPETFPDFLRFLYSGSVGSITSENVYDLYRAADKYDVQDLKDECLVFMRSHLDADNVRDVIALALQYNETDLINEANKIFPDFLRLLKCGKTDSITPQNVCFLYRAADKYDVQDFKSECLTFMRSHLDVDNFCDVITLASQFSETDIINQATDFFVENMAKIVRTAKWQEFLTENPIQANGLFIKSLPADKTSDL